MVKPQGPGEDQRSFQNGGWFGPPRSSSSAAGCHQSVPIRPVCSFPHLYTQLISISHSINWEKIIINFPNWSQLIPILGVPYQDYHDSISSSAWTDAESCLKRSNPTLRNPIPSTSSVEACLEDTDALLWTASRWVRNAAPSSSPSHHEWWQ